MFATVKIEQLSLLPFFYHLKRTPGKSTGFPMQLRGWEVSLLHDHDLIVAMEKFVLIQKWKSWLGRECIS